MTENSRFEGNVLSLIGWKLFGTFLTVITLGFGYPVYLCFLHEWEAENTVINGRRLSFNGKAGDLFVKWLLWELAGVGGLIVISIFTFSLAAGFNWRLLLLSGVIDIAYGLAYAAYLQIKVKRWTISNTTIEGGAQKDWDVEDEQKQDDLHILARDMVTADGMDTYCAFYHYDCGLSQEERLNLFRRAEQRVPPELEVMLTFIARMDFIDGEGDRGPCACVYTRTRLIIAWENGEMEIPIDQIDGYSLQNGRPYSTLFVRLMRKTVRLGLSRKQARDIYQLCRIVTAGTSEKE